MTVEDFNPAGPISLSHWNAAVQDLTRRTEAGELHWVKIQVYEAVEPVFQAGTGERLVQLAARQGERPTDFLIGTDFDDIASGSFILKVYDADRRHILTSTPMEALDGLKETIDAQLNLKTGEVP